VPDTRETNGSTQGPRDPALGYSTGRADNVVLGRFGRLGGEVVTGVFKREQGRGDPFLKSRRKLQRPAILLSAGATLVPVAAMAAPRVPISLMIQHEHQGPLSVTGRNFVYDYKTNTFIVTGNAAVRQQASILTADEIDLARGKRELHAKGNVHLVDPLTEIRAREGRINLTDETGDLTNATITSYNKTFRLQGARIHKLTGQRYSILDGDFTTCAAEPGTPDWSISADRMDLHVGGTATGTGAHFNVLGHPVLYSPYALFPADSTRHSGLLSPRIGESGLRGFQLLQPYYWAINRSSDASFALDVETAQRIGGLAEYRLLTGPDNYFVVDGGFYDESIRSTQNRQNDIIDYQVADPFIPTDRYDLFGMMRQHITDNLVFYGNTTTVSDPFLLRELNVWTLSRNASTGIFYPSQIQLMRNAMSNFGLLDSYQNGYLQVGGTYNQDLIQPQSFATQSLPQILLSGRKELLGGLLYTDYGVTGDNFYRESGQDGLRLDLNPTVTLPWRLGDYLYGFGTLGLRETMYDTSGHWIDVTPVGQDGRLFNNALSLGPLAPGGFQSRELMYGSAGIATELEKVYNLNWEPVEKLKHTIEPFVTYSYVPNLAQSSLPLFDEIDRIEARSLITYGATSRIFLKLASQSAPTEGSGGKNGQPQTQLGVHPFMARSYVNGSTIEEILRVTVEQAYDTAHAVAKGSSHFSDLDVIATAFPNSTWAIGGQLTYSPQVAELHYANGYLNFRPWWLNNNKIWTGSYLQLGYNYIGPGPDFQPGINASANQFMTMQAYYELFKRVAVLFGPAYDFTSHKLLSAQYGLRIKAPCNCWAFDMGISDTFNPNETLFQFQLTLGGLGSVGRSPFGRMPFQSRLGVLPGLQ
jgi:LPS-assembly protein